MAQELKGEPKDSGKVTPAQIIVNLVRTHRLDDSLAEQRVDIPEVFLEDANKLLKDSLRPVSKEVLIDIIYDLTMFIAENPEVNEEALLRAVNTSLGLKPDIMSDD